MLIYFILLNWSLSMLFIFLNHPLSLGCVLLAQTIIIALSTGLLLSNFWFSYILFLIMIGGMMIMFIYMTSLASNEKFTMPNKMMSLTTMTLLPIMILMFFFDKFFTIQSSQSKLSEKPLFFNFTLNKMFSMPNMYMMMTLIMYLLLTLIVVTKIIDTKFGTLRQK